MNTKSISPLCACAVLFATLTLLASNCDAFIMGYGRPRATGGAAKRLDKRLFSFYGISPTSLAALGGGGASEYPESPAAVASSPSFNSLVSSPYADSYDASDMLSYDAAARLSSAAAAAASELRMEQQHQQALLGELLFAAATSADGVRPADVAEAARRERQTRLAQRQQLQQQQQQQQQRAALSNKDLDAVKSGKV